MFFSILVNQLLNFQDNSFKIMITIGCFLNSFTCGGGDGGVRVCSCCCLIYQTVHFLAGFISVLRGQWKSEANSGMFDNAPLTRNRAGEC